MSKSVHSPHVLSMGFPAVLFQLRLRGVRWPCIPSAANAPSACVSWRVCLKYFSYFKVAVGSPEDPERLWSHLRREERGVSAYPSAQTKSFATRQQASGSVPWAPATANTLHTERAMAHRGHLARGNPLSATPHPSPASRQITKPFHHIDPRRSR